MYCVRLPCILLLENATFSCTVYAYQVFCLLLENVKFSCTVYANHVLCLKRLLESFVQTTPAICQESTSIRITVRDYALQKLCSGISNMSKRMQICSGTESRQNISVADLEGVYLNALTVVNRVKHYGTQH